MAPALRSSPKHGPEAEYEMLLAESLALQSEFERTAERVKRAREVGKHDRAAEIEEIMPPFGPQLNLLLRRRVELLRQIEHLKTIEDVFPRVKSPRPEQRREVDATALMKKFNAGRASADDLTADASQITGTLEAKDLTDDEFHAYLKARAGLAQELGYKLEMPLGERSFNISRNGVSMSMEQFAMPSGFGIMGRSRISKIAAARGTKAWPPTEFWFDGGYDRVSKKPAVQREIDRAIAIFG